MVPVILIFGPRLLKMKPKYHYPIYLTYVMCFANDPMEASLFLLVIVLALID
jgi:hypothetical protein